ncbi:MAG TPA: DUF6531 domain-containing protein, partial [Acidimicrobiia bacterium]
MAVAEGGFGVWAVRLRQASQALHPEARWLAADVGGPLYAVGHMAASDVWGGPFADQLRGAIRYLDHQLTGWAEHLNRLHGALEQASWEAESAVRLEAAGVIPHFDVLGALAPWRRWPSPSPPLPVDWAAGGSRTVGLVWVYPDRARQLAEGLRTTAEQVRGARNRVANGLSPVGIDTPPFLEPVAAGLEDIADEIDRRVTLLEQVDRELAGAFRDLAAGLGFPGSLAPPKTFNPADPIGSSLAGLRAGADAGPGRQPAQVKEADPVSTSTGNYLYEAVDLAQPARGTPTVFARTYNSLRAGTDGPLGFGWTHSLGTRLVADDGGITVVWGDGHEERHSVQEGGAFVPPPGVHDRLRRTGDGFELATRAGVVHPFAADGRLMAVTNRSGNISVLEYAEGRLVRLVDASGVATSFEHDDAGRIATVAGVLDRRWAYAYSRAGDLVTVTDPEGGVTSYGYDGHQLVSITDAEGRSVVRNVYDGVGRVVEQRDGAGGRWRYRYEEGRSVVTDPLGHTKAFRFDERYRTTAVTDASGATTRFSWDEASNLVAAEEATGRTFRFAYNPNGEVTVAEGPGSAPVRFEWDDEGNLTAVVSAEGHRAEFTWDNASRPVRLVSPAGIVTTIAWRADGLPESVREGDDATTRYTFDGAGRPASITDPLGAVTMVEFDAAGRPVAERHPGGEGTTFSWDGCDRLVAVTDHTGATTRYAYDRCGQLISATDPLGRITRYAYGPLGLLASVTDPLGRETTFTYDACGRLLTRTDARGDSVSFSYDPAGRLVRIEAPSIAPISYGWDAAGRLVAMTDATGQTTWELDEAGRPTVDHRRDSTDLHHAYDTLGRRRRLELRRAETLMGAWEYGFDPDGRITSVLDPDGGTTLLGYDPAGRLASLRHPNGVATTWAYDLAGQPIGLGHTGPDGARLTTWTNTFDADGNLVQSERQAGESFAAVETFEYDHLGRLISTRNGNGSEAFSWDHASNRTGVGDNGTMRPASYDDADQVTTSGTCTYRHDQVGNLVERTGGQQPALTCAYDALGRVIELRAGDEVVTFGYDGLGRRVTRTGNDGTTTRIFDGASVLADLAADGTATLETTAGLLVLHRQGPSGRSYLHADANTNVSEVTDNTGAIMARFSYTPFGARNTSEGAEAGTPLAFCGTIGVRVEAGGLLDMRARLYDPTLGRFTSPDPWPAYIPEPITLNRYLYALGDPILQVDPLGLFCWTGKNKHGKCRGLGDVADKALDVTKDVADFAEEPLSFASKVSAGVAVVAAGVTALCSFPCGVVSAPVAT